MDVYALNSHETALLVGATGQLSVTKLDPLCEIT